MARKSGSKDFASKQSLNPTGRGRESEKPGRHDQAQQQRQPDIEERKVGQYSGEGTPPLQKR